MAYKKTADQISHNMSCVRNSGTAIENALCDELIKRGVTTFSRNDKSVYGKPDIVFKARKIAIFCDGDFWHGYNWKTGKQEIKSHQEFWINKIEKNMQRDAFVTTTLQDSGWTVLRFWGHDIKKDPGSCVDRIFETLQTVPDVPYRTIDLCAGIGGIRRGFERTGHFVNVLSSETDKYSCRTYQHIFGDNPMNDLTTEDFKTIVRNTSYEILLAGFPCQTFSRAGNQKGFADDDKGQIFFHIAQIIRETRPIAIFLENVDHLITHNEGKSMKEIIRILVTDLGYHVVGVTLDENGNPVYTKNDFVRNSRDFGVPQNRPRTYIIGFDTERIPREQLETFPKELPFSREDVLYDDLNSVLESDVDAHYYISSGYLETLMKHRARQEEKGYGFGYRIVNEPGVEHPIANTLLATGGSGKERNLIYDPREGIAGTEIKGKKTKLNNRGIRFMTPTEWGKLQGFVGYAFVDQDGIDRFSFPDTVSDEQRYKQFGNAVTIPVVEEMAEFIYRCLRKGTEVS